MVVMVAAAVADDVVADDVVADDVVADDVAVVSPQAFRMTSPSQP